MINKISYPRCGRLRVRIPHP